MDPDSGMDWDLGLVGVMGVIMSPKNAQALTLAERLAQGKLPRLN